LSETLPNGDARPAPCERSWEEADREVCVVTIGAWVVLLTVFGSLLVALVVGALLAMHWVRDRRIWSGPNLPMQELIAPMGELQDPQYADQRGSGVSGVDEAHDTAVAVIGIGIKPFTNRAPLSVPRSSRSMRHG
jgi:hypothetical protein